MNTGVLTRELDLTYRSASGEVAALRRIGLAIPAPAIVGLVGRNQAGKSSLLRVLAGREPRFRGEVLLDGVPTTRSMRHAIVAGDRWPSAFGETFQSLARRLARVYEGFDLARFADLMRRFGVEPRSSAQSRGAVSSALACLALASRAPLTMLDEPTLGMDAPSRRTLAEAIIEEQGEVPRIMMVSTHLIDESAALFERVVVLKAGRVIADGEPDELTGDYRRVYAPVELIATLEPVGPVARLGDRAEAIVAAQQVPASARPGPVGLQDLVTALTEPVRQ